MRGMLALTLVLDPLQMASRHSVNCQTQNCNVLFVASTFWCVLVHVSFTWHYLWHNSVSTKCQQAEYQVPEARHQNVDSCLYNMVCAGMYIILYCVEHYRPYNMQCQVFNTLRIAHSCSTNKMCTQLCFLQLQTGCQQAVLQRKLSLRTN